MKQRIKAILLAGCLSGVGVPSIQAQFTAGADGLVILANTPVSIESLNMIPATDINLSGKQITVSHTAVTSLTPPSIKRVITINSPFSFSGNIGLNYLSSELNGNTPISLNVFYQTGDLNFKTTNLTTYDVTGNKVMAATVGPPILFAQVTAAAATSGAPLPLTLLSFDAKLQNDRTLLDWTTTHESNVSHFEIERAATDQQFTPIGRIVAAGNNSSALQAYAFIDDKPLPGLSFYRLKMLDLDARFSYSRIIPVRAGTMQGTLLYPNPARTALMVEWKSDRIEKAIYRLQAADGRTVLSGIFNIQKGINLFTINLAGLSSGTYLLTASNGLTAKFVKE